MDIKTIKLSELIPAEYNPRKITKQEQQKLSNNLKEFGLVDPIIINLKNNHIIGGHQRYQTLLNDNTITNNESLSLIELGDIGWAFDDSEFKINDETHEKLLNISLNKIDGSWDYSKLIQTLQDIQETSFDITLTGFHDIELSALDHEIDMEISDDLFGDEYYDIPESTMSKKHKMCKCPKCQHEWKLK